MPKRSRTRHEQLISLIPQDERKLSSQMRDALRPIFLVQVERDFAVGARAKPVAALFEFAALSLEIIKLTVHDDVDPPVLAGDRLIARGKIDDAEPRMAKPDPVVAGNPDAMAVGAAMMEASNCRL